jgi:hypothetical protein
MKYSTFSTKLLGLMIMLMFSLIELQARDASIAAPVVASLDTTPPPTTPPAPTTTAVDTTPTTTTTTAEPEKEKKEGFNSKTRFGLRLGGVISKQDYESSNSLAEQPESKIGLDLAIIASIPIGGGLFMIQPELHWMQKGYKIPSPISGQDTTTTLEYIEVPLLARINFGGSIRLYVFAGPSFGWLIGGKYNPENGLDPTDYLEETEVSGVVGLGVGLANLEVDVRYMAGLSDVSSTEEFKDAKNSSFGAGLTLKF